jgi:hypothetical protein
MSRAWRQIATARRRRSVCRSFSSQHGRGVCCGRKMRSDRANGSEQRRTCWREWPEGDPGGTLAPGINVSPRSEPTITAPPSVTSRLACPPCVRLNRQGQRQRDKSEIRGGSLAVVYPHLASRIARELHPTIQVAAILRPFIFTPGTPLPRTPQVLDKYHDTQHMDICGALQAERRGKRYNIVIDVDDYLRTSPSTLPITPLYSKPSPAWY